MTRRLLLVCMVLTQLGGCALGYYAQAVGGQVDLLRRRVPIDRLLAEPGLDPGLATKLGWVIELREFAVTELGLPDNSSYRSFVALDRDTIVWNVVATAEFSVEPRQWCFPLVGCVSYRGYFREGAAQRYARRLAARGYDVYVGGSSAYSTLGYFADPVLSSMLADGDRQLAEVLFHELAHQRLYIRSDTALSEAFATALAEFGTELWLARRAGTSASDDYRRGLCYRDEFGALMVRQQERLRELFGQPLSGAEMRAEKAAAYARLRSDYADTKARWGGYAGYDAWAERLTNNAELAAFTTYRQWVPALRRHLDEVGIASFYRDLETLSELPPERRTALLEQWRPSQVQRPACWRNSAS